MTDWDAIYKADALKELEAFRKAAKRVAGQIAKKSKGDPVKISLEALYKRRNKPELRGHAETVAVADEILDALRAANSEAEDAGRAARIASRETESLALRRQRQADWNALGGYERELAIARNRK